MQNLDPLESASAKRLQLFLLVTPVIGFFPALWMLYRRQGNSEIRAASRLSLTLAFAWLFGHLLLELGANSAESWQIPLLLMSSLLTTSYFLMSLGLMVRIWKRQPLWLPWISHVANQVLGSKHLS